MGGLFKLFWVKFSYFFTEQKNYIVFFPRICLLALWLSNFTGI